MWIYKVVVEYYYSFRNLVSIEPNTRINFNKKYQRIELKKRVKTEKYIITDKTNLLSNSGLMS